MVGNGTCQLYLLFHDETELGNGFRGFLYFVALAYCFIGLSAITARFFRSMENVVKHTRTVEEIDPCTNTKIVKHIKVWNYTIADITLLAFGTSFPQISLATIDAIRNLGNLYAGGLGPGTLVGSAAFDLFPIHAVCVVIPKAGELKKISDLGVWLIELFWYGHQMSLLSGKLHRQYCNSGYCFYMPMPKISVGPTCLCHYQEVRGQMTGYQQKLLHTRIKTRLLISTLKSLKMNMENGSVVDIFSVHDGNRDYEYQNLPDNDVAESSDQSHEGDNLLSIWKQQFVDAFVLESPESRKLNNTCLRLAKAFWQLLLAPWRILFAFVPPYQIAHGWIAFICSLIFIRDSLHCHEAYRFNKLRHRY
ncbi:UNVERIFIED_CONTAM: Magnesium/proton exchanger [Sesamum angustifolium]|uniref:Magnesium/proton exchanger n=1 Tax=Sesamum angustifolium TaxID=2727405 RepID=A0AAW2QUJ7_9LAMI